MIDISFSALLKLLTKILSKPNGLSNSTYQVKKIICLLTLGIEKIHACLNHCMLYRKEHEFNNRCPRYNTKDYSSHGQMTSWCTSLLQTIVVIDIFCPSLLCYHCSDTVVATDQLPVITVAYRLMSQWLFIVVWTTFDGGSQLVRSTLHAHHSVPGILCRSRVGQIVGGQGGKQMQVLFLTMDGGPHHHAWRIDQPDLSTLPHPPGRPYI
jgi:hypothetical protein